ncbi:MAG TPA: hypothetical protein VFA34_04425 [Actinomycetota bacterium]|jgi:hypothetical protein|nr:hypothetical protein [Actinomycetota bacterium]
MRLKRGGAVLGALAVIALLGGTAHAQTPTPARAIRPALDCQSDSSASADFNGDQIDDIAMAAPLDDVANAKDVGSLNVVYGVDGVGLDTSADDQLISPGMQGLPAFRWVFGPGRLFGKALAAGDFNDDNFTDLAVGMPGAPVDEFANTGAVFVLYGSSSGVVSQSAQVLHQDAPGMPEHNDVGDSFGWTLAAGDFNGDGADDLAVAAPGEDFGKIKDGGAVWVVYGKAGARAAGGGLSATAAPLKPQLLVQGARGLLDAFEPGDMFGLALAAGNFDGDAENGKPVDDLAVGVPHEDIGIRADTGAVQVIYSSSAGLSSDDQFWHQAAPNVEGANETGDLYGCSLAAGNFNGQRNGSIDADGLAIGVPGEDVLKSNQGGVNVIYPAAEGSGLSATAGGLNGRGDQFFVERPGIAGLQEQPEINARFGQALNAQNINPQQKTGTPPVTDPSSELVIGVPGASGGTGQIFVIGGVAGDGLRDLQSNSYMLSQSTFGTHRAAEGGDEFGRTLAFGDHDKDGDPDLVVGAPGDSACGTVAETAELLSIGPGIPVGGDAVPGAGAALALFNDGSEIGAMNGPNPHLTPPGLGNWSLSRCDYLADGTSFYGLSGDPQAAAAFSATVAGL